MSVTVRTAYPCIICGELISPSDKHCRHCGAKQPDRTHAVVYNIFTCLKGKDVFNMTYFGDMILELFDAVQLVAESGVPEHFDAFIGSYIASDGKRFGEGQLQVLSWTPVSAAGLGDDQGQRMIKITSLE